MRVVSLAVLALYFAALSGLAVYGIHRAVLALIHLRRPRAGSRPAAAAGPLSPLPPITVQLPVYNEICVLDRIVGAACALRYPRDLLEIQILDDSTDATASRARDLAASWRERGFDVTCLHRDGRAGFKAGALAGGLERARGAFIAVFDADFVPPPDFLERTLPHFADPRVGMVQARWGHLNRDDSALTRAQALMLDGHFVVEQAARASSGRFFNFNGTAGIFRRTCIEGAGGWQADTLTEDLDISYRAQMRGWRFVFLPDLVCPAEIPAEFNALRQQQRRWAKGSIQTARKILPALLRSGASFRAKSEAFLHLTNNAAYLLLLAASLLLIPSILVRRGMGWGAALPDLVVFLAGTGSFTWFSALSMRGRGLGVVRAAVEIAGATALGAGLALNNSVAVVEALAGIPSEFKRTPKLGKESESGLRRPRAPTYRGDPTRLAAAEAALSLIFSGAIAWAAREGLYASLPFLALFAVGYGYAAGLTWAQGAGIRLSSRGLAHGETA